MKATTTVATYGSKFSKKFQIVVGIYDAITQIQLTHNVSWVVSRSSFRAECIAIDNAKHFVLAEWACKRMCSRYGITATQFMAMLDDRAIKPLESYTFKVESVETYV